MIAGKALMNRIALDVEVMLLEYLLLSCIWKILGGILVGFVPLVVG